MLTRNVHEKCAVLRSPGNSCSHETIRFYPLLPLIRRIFPVSLPRFSSAWVVNAMELSSVSICDEVYRSLWLENTRVNVLELHMQIAHVSQRKKSKGRLFIIYAEIYMEIHGRYFQNFLESISFTCTYIYIFFLSKLIICTSMHISEFFLITQNTHFRDTAKLILAGDAIIKICRSRLKQTSGETSKGVSKIFCSS